MVGAFNTHMPQRTERIGNKVSKNDPWMTKGIKNSIAKQKKLYKMTLQKNSNPSILEKYQNHRKIIQQVKRKAKPSAIEVDVRSLRMTLGNYGI